MKYFIFLYLIPCSLSAQIRGVVKDSISGEPIPFVNIWVENETVGTTSEADGTFFLEASKEKNIVISVLGYERKTLKGTAISIVQLKPMTYDLAEVVILNKKQSKIIEIGDIKNAIFQSFDNGPKIETKFIKEVTVFTDSRIDDATIKLHFYSVDENGSPGKELLTKDYIVTLKKGIIKHRFVISQFDLIFPEKGMFVAYEKLLIESNKTGSKYQPYVLYNYVERDFFYTYAYGKWTKLNAETQGKLQLNEPAINLVLSN
jgi:hypothetical protein